jgi:hypothetical protein
MKVWERSLRCLEILVLLLLLMAGNLPEPSKTGERLHTQPVQEQ